MQVVLTGAHGQLGMSLLPYLERHGEVTALTRADCDLSSPDAIRKMMAELRPEVVVNAAAYTQVNDAETNREAAYALNCTAPATLAAEARRTGAMFVHYSTDYVFDGRQPGEYTESDEPAPLNVYGASKLAGERAVAEAGGRFLILRTSWVYSATGTNFLLTIRRLASEREELKIVDDQVGSPTSAAQLARATEELIRQYASHKTSTFPCGLYHATAADSVSWYGFARAIVDALQAHESLKVKNILPIASSDFPTPTRRPLNSVLSNGKFERTFGFRLANWKTGLAEIVKEITTREAKS
jgi:dTDP-4-dehydrorhamnose reductase